MIVVLDANAPVEMVLKLPQAEPIRSAVADADYVTARRSLPVISNTSAGSTRDGPCTESPRIRHSVRGLGTTQFSGVDHKRQVTQRTGNSPRNRGVKIP